MSRSRNSRLLASNVHNFAHHKLRESELFVIVPAKWADNLVAIIGDTPDVKGIYEATRPEDSPYWERQKAKAERAAGSDDSRRAKEKYGLEISLPWDEEALQAIMKAPRFVRKMAVGNVEDYAEEHGETRITLEVVKAQAESVGMGKFMRDLGGNNGNSWLRRLFRKR